MNHPTADSKPPAQFKSTAIDCIALALLCAVLYLPGIHSLGLINWQEGQRALVAREMLRNNEWVVPTRGGEPYLAKPPVIYWCQMGLSRLRGAHEVEPIDLRLTVAIAGFLGVISTYFVARTVTEDDKKRPAALISALGLAVGVLYVRSARVGELDILLVPCAVGAIGAVYLGWVCARGPAFRWGCLALAALFCALAALTKGPPAIAVIALVAYGAPAWHTARAHGNRWSWPASAIVALAFAVYAALGVDSATDAVSTVMHAAIGASIGGVLSVLCRGGWFKAVIRLHPEVVVGAGIIALWGWSMMVGARVGEEVVAAAADAEASDNLRLLVVDSPLKNAGFFAYGLLPIGLFGGLELWRIASRRSEIPRGALLCVAWVCVGFVLMSVAGKGVARYLTPVWPGLAILGGVWIAREAHSAARRAVVAGVLLAAACVMGVWYGAVRLARAAENSPEAIVGELLALGATNETIGTFGFDAPAAAFYAGGDIDWWTLGGTDACALQIGEAVVGGGAYYLLVREEPGGRVAGANAELRGLLEGEGLRVDALGMSVRYVRDRTGSDVGVWLVSDSARR